MCIKVLGGTPGATRGWAMSSLPASRRQSPVANVKPGEVVKGVIVRLARRRDATTAAGAI
jgi:hypothetical protein